MLSYREITKEKSMPSRREFIEVASAAALSALVPGGLAAQLAGDRNAAAFNPSLLAPADEIWGWLKTVNAYGPHYTGTEAHHKFVEFLASGMQSAGIEIT